MVFCFIQKKVPNSGGVVEKRYVIAEVCEELEDVEKRTVVVDYIQVKSGSHNDEC